RFIKGQVNRPDSILFDVHKIVSAGGQEKGIYAPAAIQGHQLMITSTKIDSIVTPGVNPYHNRLFYSTLVEGNLQNVIPVMINGMDASLNQGTASLSANGDYLYFTQWKKEKGQSVSSIYFSTKTDSGWGIPVLLPLVNSEVYNSKQPFCSAEGKYLFFASDRPGGSGNFDIWVSVLHPDGSAAEPVNVGEIINTAANEQAPFYHSSSHSLVFASDRKPGMGGFDLFTSKGWDMNWEKPNNMGYPVNSSRDDLYFFAPEKGTLLSKAIISSDRGSDCCLETYTITKTPKKNLIKGIVQDCKNNEPIADVEVIMKSVSGKVVSTKTGSDGTYQFEISGYADEQQLILGKELYKEKTSSVTITGNDDTSWLVDVFSNEPICMEKKLVIKPENVVTLYFDFDKSNLKDRGMMQLDSIYSVLYEDSVATIQISGYTDGRGTEEYNKILSDKRARACADYLVEKGIDPNRISFESFGACCPIEMEMINGRDNADGRSRNRRALINIKKD
ncbi:MAG: OmpA family protein, partial [Chitinophagaceae bacterium]